MRKGASKFGMTVILNSLNRMHIYIYMMVMYNQKTEPVSLLYNMLPRRE